MRLLDLFAIARAAFCQHEFVWQRRANGEMGVRCLKCFKASALTIEQIQKLPVPLPDLTFSKIADHSEVKSTVANTAQ